MIRHARFLATTLCCLLGALLLALPSGAAAKSKKKKSKDSGIEFPSGLDDTLIERLQAGQSAQKVLAVLDFEGSDKLREKVDLRMSEMLTTALVQTARFELVERNKIDAAIREQKLGMVGVIDDATAAEMGQILGAEYMVLGSVTSAARKRTDKFGYILVETVVGVDVRAVHSTTGKILLSETAEGLSSGKEIRDADGRLVQGVLEDDAAFAQAARDAVDQVSAKIAGLSPLIGFVVLANGGELTIDLGDASGVAAGDRFVVFRLGEEILHPVNGTRLGWKKEILQELEIDRTQKQMSTGTVVKSVKDAEAAPGDLVISR